MVCRDYSDPSDSTRMSRNWRARDNLRRFVALRKVPGVAGHEPVRIGSFGALKETVARFVGRYGNRAGRLYDLRDLPDRGHGRVDLPLLKLKTRPAKHPSIFGEYGRVALAAVAR